MFILPSLGHWVLTFYWDTVKTLSSYCNLMQCLNQQSGLKFIFTDVLWYMSFIISAHHCLNNFITILLPPRGLWKFHLVEPTFILKLYLFRAPHLKVSSLWKTKLKNSITKQDRNITDFVYNQYVCPKENLRLAVVGKMQFTNFLCVGFIHSPIVFMITEWMK